MTDRDILNLILSEIQDMKTRMQSLDARMQRLETRVQGLETELRTFKAQTLKSISELKSMDETILDEVERVHSILDKHKNGKTIHMA